MPSNEGAVIETYFCKTIALNRVKLIMELKLITEKLI